MSVVCFISYSAFLLILSGEKYALTIHGSALTKRRSNAQTSVPRGRSLNEELVVDVCDVQLSSQRAAANSSPVSIKYMNIEPLLPNNNLGPGRRTRRGVVLRLGAKRLTVFMRPRRRRAGVLRGFVGMFGNILVTQALDLPPDCRTIREESRRG